MNGVTLQELLKDNPRAVALLRARALRNLARDLKQDKIGPAMAAKILEDHATELEKERK